MPTVKSERPYKKRWSIPPPVHVPGASIYAIINEDNKKVYIGSAIRTSHRWTCHRGELEDGEHANPYFQSAFNANPTAFQAEVVEWIKNPTKEYLLQREQFWMDFFKSYESSSGYNAAPRASSCLGIKHPPEYGKAVSLRQTGKKMSPEALAAYRMIRSKIKQKGRIWTSGDRLKMSLRKMGSKHGDAAKKKMSIARIGKILPKKGRKVIQIKDGIEIATWRSIAYAAQYLGIKECNIRQCVNHHPNWKAGGFTWRAVE
jgi:group I intron endonuclease